MPRPLLPNRFDLVQPIDCRARKPASRTVHERHAAIRLQDDERRGTRIQQRLQIFEMALALHARRVQYPRCALERTQRWIVATTVAPGASLTSATSRSRSLLNPQARAKRETHEIHDNANTHQRNDERRRTKLRPKNQMNDQPGK